MTRFRLTVGKRVTMLVLCAIVGFVAVASFNRLQMEKVFNGANFANANSVPRLEALSKLQLDFNSMRIMLSKHIMYTDSMSKFESERDLQAVQTQLLQEVADYGKFVSDANSRQLHQLIKAGVEDYFRQTEGILAASNVFDLVRARQLFIDVG